MSSLKTLTGAGLASGGVAAKGSAGPWWGPPDLWEPGVTAGHNGGKPPLGCLKV